MHDSEHPGSSPRIRTRRHRSPCHCRRTWVDSGIHPDCPVCTWVKCPYGDCGCNYRGRPPSDPRR